MLNLKDGTLWQWDLGRKIIITVDKGSTIDRVQFYNGIEDHAREGVVEVDDQGRTLAAIPDGLLQYSNNLSVYLVTTTQFGVKTQEQITLVVNPRAKPEDYIFTDNEVRTYQKFVDDLEYLKKNLVTPDKVEEVVTETMEAEAEKFLSADTKDNTVTFKSDDSVGTTEAPLVWLSTEVLGNGEKHSVLFNKVSRMFQNIRFIWGLIGTADISAYGDGTIRGAIRALKELIDTKEIPEDVLRQSDVVDNLESNRADLPLSARMGKTLNENMVRYNPETDMFQILLNGVWTDCTRANAQETYLFNEGDACVSLTGGWTKSTTNANGSVSIGNTLRVYSDTNNSTYRGTLVTKNLIDLTKFNKLRCFENVGTHSRLVLSKTTNPHEGTALGDKGLVIGENELNISNYTGSYYVIYTCVNGAGAWYEVSEISLSKN